MALTVTVSTQWCQLRVYTACLSLLSTQVKHPVAGLETVSNENHGFMLRHKESAVPCLTGRPFTHVIALNTTRSSVFHTYYFLSE